RSAVRVDTGSAAVGSVTALPNCTGVRTVRTLTPPHPCGAARGDPRSQKLGAALAAELCSRWIVAAALAAPQATDLRLWLTRWGRVGRRGASGRPVTRRGRLTGVLGSPVTRVRIARWWRIGPWRIPRGWRRRIPRRGIHPASVHHAGAHRHARSHPGARERRAGSPFPAALGEPLPHPDHRLCPGVLLVALHVELVQVAGSVHELLIELVLPLLRLGLRARDPDLRLSGVDLRLNDLILELIDARLIFFGQVQIELGDLQ